VLYILVNFKLLIWWTLR